MSNSSLYGVTGNVTVSANNLTTLYNSTPSNVVTANVPARNFTTLYTQQSDISPTLPYGNSNVEAFLNVGHDGGGNVVQNINMSGNLNVGGQSFLGNVTNVHIDGGTLNFVLTTDGNGGLTWTEQNNGNATPYIHFDVTTTANNQQFTDSLLANYLDPIDFNVMKNGVNIEPTLYEKINNTTLQVNILLNDGDSIDVLASGAGGATPGGNITEVQYNGGAGLFSGNGSFAFDQANGILNVTNINTGNVNMNNINVVGTSDLGNISNITITGGTANYVLRTDGLGNLSWTSVSAGLAAGSNTQLQFNSGTGFGASSNLTFNTTTSLLSASFIAGDGSNISNITGANVTGTVANATYATNAGTATTATSATTAGYAVTAGSTAFAENANVANIANSVNGSNVSGNVPTATLAYGLDATLANTHIAGGSGGYVLSTDGSGNLTWVSVSASAGGTNTYVQFNDGGSLGGVSNFAFNKVSNTLTITNSNTTNANITTANITTANITTAFISTGNVTTALNALADVRIQRAYEKVTITATAATGTINYNILDQSVLYYTSNASANFTLNVRGNSTITLNNSLSTNESVTFAFLNTVGATAYVPTSFTVDGVSVTPKYVNGVAPTSGTRLTAALQSYTYTLVKTAANTYSALGSLTEYK